LLRRFGYVARGLSADAGLAYYHQLVAGLQTSSAQRERQDVAEACKPLEQSPTLS
jgi:hypothetical protein